MKLRLLFTVLIILLGAVLIYQKAPGEDFKNFSGFLQKVSQEKQEGKVEKDQSSKGKEASKQSLVNQELPSLPKASETKPVGTKEVSTPPPLKVTPPPSSEPAPSSVLTRSGIILQTNFQRQQNGLGFLKENGPLDAMASEKANDMCKKQYFAHTSSLGVGVADLANSFGYDYISVGENLALGPFAGDEEVVEAWMNSPGHRANILNSRFSEIGVGVTSCVFNEGFTWLAVQQFGKPVSDCPSPDVALRRTIDDKKATLAETRSRLLVLRAEIEASDPEIDPDYNNKVNSYNSLVRDYNNLIGETRTLINQYSSQVTAFNICAAG